MSQENSEEIRKLVERFNRVVKKSFIPPRKEWTPPDQALYGVIDLFNTPPKQARELRFKAIKYCFNLHYTHNKFYRSFCKENNVKPLDIKTEKDLLKIPLLPDKFFKDYPVGKEFALWLSNIFTGEIPNISIDSRNPSFDDLIDVFNEAGLAVMYSSGTSGRHTFIPRDEKTFTREKYAAAKSLVIMTYPRWDFEKLYAFLPVYAENTNLFATKTSCIYPHFIKNVEYGVLIKKRVTTETVQNIMRGKRNLLLKLGALWVEKKQIKETIKWLKKRDEKKDNILLVAAPFLLDEIMDVLEEKNLSFSFGEGSAVITGGGWKIREDARITTERFRKKVEKTLGIPSEGCIDFYGMVEMNGGMVHCQEGHYLHVPYSFNYPMVLNAENETVDFGEWGRFAFLDGLATSYPGFIISGDRVRILEHCPVCDRPGPVLEPEVTRAKGEEVRGCAEELRKLFDSGA